jgi:hypothetical protein
MELRHEGVFRAQCPAVDNIRLELEPVLSASLPK